MTNAPPTTYYVMYWQGIMHKGSITPSKKIILMEEQKQIQAIEEIVRRNLEVIGEDANREGLLKTPRRVARSMLALTSGYNQDPVAILNSAKFAEDCNKMIMVKDIEFYSLCEHHILPFFGKAHIAYIPNGHIVGLSKLPRVVDVFARRLQVQERLTREICQCIQDTLNAKGVMVVLEAQHLCMQMRGVEKQGAITVTREYTGQFVENTSLRQEFLDMIK